MISRKSFAYGLLCVQSDQTLKKIGLIVNTLWGKKIMQFLKELQRERLMLSFHFRSKIG